MPRPSHNLLIGNKSGFIYEIEISEYIASPFIRVIYAFRLSIHGVPIEAVEWKFIGNNGRPNPLKFLWHFY